MSLSVCPPFVCPPGINIPHTQVRGGQTFLTHRREGGQTFFTQRGWNKPFYIDGGTNILASRGGDKHFLLEAVVPMMMMMKRWL